VEQKCLYSVGEQDESFLEEHNACVYGAGFSNFHEGTSLINKIEPADPRYINILAGSRTVDLDFKDSRL